MTNQKKELVLKAIQKHASAANKKSITEIELLLAGKVSHPVVLRWINVLELEGKICAEHKSYATMVWAK